MSEEKEGTRGLQLSRLLTATDMRVYFLWLVYHLERRIFVKTVMGNI
jgi:hypothetical protein